MFEKIAIGLKTILRDDHLFAAIDGIEKRLPGAQIIVVDDGRMNTLKRIAYEDLQNKGHQVHIMPFDSGFGAKSNRMVEGLQRPYLLIGSDDFEFDDPKVPEGIERMIRVLDTGRFDIASGRVNDNPYEFDLDLLRMLDSGIVVERPVLPTYGNVPVRCDITVNYSLIRKEVFDKVRWDSEAKIGQGEHGAFFYDVAMSGFKVCYLPGVNINEQIGKPINEEYKALRRRGRSPERSCFVKRGIKCYILGNGQVDYDATVRN